MLILPFVFFLAMVAKATVFPTCDQIKIPQGLAILYYGQCGQCLPMTSTTTFGQTDSFFVDCPNNQFILYHGVGCNAQNISSYNGFRPYFCQGISCCMFRKMGSNYSGAYTYYGSFVYNGCASGCVGESTTGDYFAFQNDTYATYHKTDTCIDTQGNNYGIKICESAAPSTTTSLTTTTPTLNNNNKNVATTSDTEENSVSIFSFLMCIALVIFTFE